MQDRKTWRSIFRWSTHQSIKYLAAMTMIGGTALLAMTQSNHLFATTQIVDCSMDTEDLQRFVDIWHQGKGIVVVRHTEKCSAMPGLCGEYDEGITGQGILDARKVGDGIRNLGDAPSIFFHSPTIRTTETAMALTSSSQEKQWLVHDCKNSLADHIKQEQLAGTNLVLTTHSHCINELTNRDGDSVLNFKAGGNENFGIAVLLSQDDQGDLVTYGCILPQQWEAIL